MSKTFQFGNGEWAVGKETALAYNDENSNFKPLPFTFDRSTGATVVNKQGLIETVGIDEPRIDFLNNTKGHLLLEPERRNLFEYSEDFNQSYWTKNGITQSIGYTAPDGSLNAYKLIANASDSSMYKVFSVTSGTTYNLSFYLKTVSGTLETTIGLGSPGFPQNEGEGGRYKNITVTNEWKRYTLTSTADATASSGVSFGGFSGFSTGEEVLIWGAQLEAGSYATSYIPTQGSAVTRSAENSVTNLNLPTNVQPTTEGTFYGEIQVFDANSSVNRNWISLDGGTGDTDDRILFYFLSGDSTPRGQVKSNLGANILSITGEPVSDNQVVKFAIAFKTNYLRFYFGGTRAGFSDSYTLNISQLNNIRFSYKGQNEMKLRDLRVYNTALTDAELIALTS